jgi:hypothetical protein
MARIEPLSNEKPVPSAKMRRLTFVFCDTIADRDAIPVGERYEGRAVYCADKEIGYQWFTSAAAWVPVIGLYRTCTRAQRIAMPHVEGRLVYESDTDILVMSDGAAWKAVGTPERWSSTSRPGIIWIDGTYEGLSFTESDTGLTYRARRTTLGVAVSGGNPLVWVPATAGGRLVLSSTSMVSNPVLATVNAGFTDLPGVSLTTTIPLAGDHTVVAEWNANVAGVNSYGGVATMNIDGSVVGFNHDYLIVPAGGNRHFFRVEWRGTLTAGAHTFKPQMSGNGLTTLTTNGYSCTIEVVSNIRN